METVAIDFWLGCWLTQDRYEKYAHKKGWKFEVVDVAQSDLKGYKVHISFSNFLLYCVWWVVDAKFSVGSDVFSIWPSPS